MLVVLPATVTLWLEGPAPYPWRGASPGLERGSPLLRVERRRSRLRQAVVNRSRSVLRHRIVAGDNPQQALPDTPGAEHGVLGLLEQAAARAALRGLPERQREAIVLRYYAGLSEGEIAAAMRISRGAVKSHTARGLSALRAALEQASSQAARPPDSDDAGSRHD